MMPLNELFEGQRIKEIQYSSGNEANGILRPHKNTLTVRIILDNGVILETTGDVLVQFKNGRLTYD